MASLPPFCKRFDPYDSPLTVWQPKLVHLGISLWEAKALVVATITKPFTGKMSTLRTARYPMGAELCPTGQKLRR